MSDGSCLIVLWRSIFDWANLIYKWAVENGKLNSVETVFSLQNGEDYDVAVRCPTELLLWALELLEKEKKCEVFRSGESSEHGVKFFSV